MGNIRTCLRMLSWVLLLSSVGINTSCLTTADNSLKDGDIIFHASQSPQSLAIQKATKSKFSHMGIIFIINQKPCVYEAEGPVKFTPLKEWIERGQNKTFVVKRLKDSSHVLTKEKLATLLQTAKSFEGTPYDPFFEWSDNKIYCSELVWKIYERSLGIELGQLHKLGEFDLEDPEVKKKLKERFGNNIPLDEPIISPSSIYDSKFLETVY